MFSVGINANASCKHIGSNSGETAPPVISQHIVQGNTSSSVLHKSGVSGIIFCIFSLTRVGIVDSKSIS